MTDKYNRRTSITALVVLGAWVLFAAGYDFDDPGARQDWDASIKFGFGYLFGAVFGWTAGRCVAKGDGGN